MDEERRKQGEEGEQKWVGTGKLAGKESAGAGLAERAPIGTRPALTARLRSASGLNGLSWGLWCLS